MLSETIPMPIKIVTVVTILGIVTTAIAIYALSKENEKVALITLFFYVILILGTYFYIKDKNIKNYIKENQVNIYMNGEPVSEKFNIEAINLRYYRIKIDGENVFLEKR